MISIDRIRAEGINKADSGAPVKQEGLDKRRVVGLVTFENTTLALAPRCAGSWPRFVIADCHDQVYILSPALS